MSDPDGDQRGPWLLHGLVAGVERTGWEFPVTLVIGGTVITGILISLSAYLALHADWMTQRSPLEALDPLALVFRGNSGGEPSDDRTQFYLRDARVFEAGILVTPPTFWQGMIASVDAVSVGTIESS